MFNKNEWDAILAWSIGLAVGVWIVAIVGTMIIPIIRVVHIAAYNTIMVGIILVIRQIIKKG